MTNTTTQAPMVMGWQDDGKTARVAVPAGRYYLGDPCYPFPNDGPFEPLWMALLLSCGFFGSVKGKAGEDSGYGRLTGDTGPVGQVTVGDETFHVVAFGTAYGDGEYQGSDRFGYGVDAGLIGLVPMALVEALDPDATHREWLFSEGRSCGTVQEFEMGVLAERDADGTLTFGPVTIKTGDDANDDEDVCWDCEQTYCDGECKDEDDDD